MKSENLLQRSITVLLFSFFLFYSFNKLQAQNSLSVTGKITDENGKGVPGVTIHVRGTVNQTSSLDDGSFKMWDLRHVSKGNI